MTSAVSTPIECPKCGTTIDVNEVLSHQLEEELRNRYELKAAEDKQLMENKLALINKEKEQLAADKEKQAQLVEQAVKNQLKEKELQLRKSLKEQLADEQAEQLQLLRQELNEKSEKVKQLNKAKIEIEKIKREKEELKSDLEAEAERKLSQQIAIERDKIQQAEMQRNKMNLSEKEKIIEQLKQQLDIAKRKAEQGSTQLQGEVQELAIEQWLAEQFPLDNIEEIKKGVRGADCLQIVNSRTQQNCGVIYYESKRTQSFKPEWIEKFKADIRDKGADIGVLVTEAMPSDLKRMGLKDGVWVCSFEEFKGLSLVLRDSVLRMSQAIAVQDNKGDKMAMLYDFLTGNEFRMQVEAIVEGFTQMQNDLIKEKRSMTALWKKREKQIEKVLLNTSYMYSSVQGIAGSAVKSLPLLELPDDNLASE
ncbi:DUF2130 domain-containing protein [Aliikangiella sp. IMCC44359]|uniref:DUF2130 domain-containing protein n=1 Tax=Aliikangiella sp. IMCC44359 TaxID=3459125 RepID=UPI00403AD0BC